MAYDLQMAVKFHHRNVEGVNLEGRPKAHKPFLVQYWWELQNNLCVLA